MRLRPANDSHRRALRDARDFLRLALARAKDAGCPALCAAIRRADKSADGATRHMQRRLMRSTGGAQ